MQIPFALHILTALKKLSYMLYEDGWTQREILESIAYRFNAGRTKETEIPFLGGVKYKRRTYQCQGVLVCPKSTEELRCLHHFTVEGYNPQVLKTVELLDDSEIMKWNSLNI